MRFREGVVFQFDDIYSKKLFFPSAEPMQNMPYIFKGDQAS